MFGLTQAEKKQRDKIITYKKLFRGSKEGMEVLFDLMNKYHMLNAHDGKEFAEGQRSVVLYILKQCNVNIEEFDKLLKGEL